MKREGIIPEGGCRKIENTVQRKGKNIPTEIGTGKKVKSWTCVGMGANQKGQEEGVKRKIR